MELSDEAKAEIKAAIDILRSDGIHIHKTYPAFLASQTKPTEDPKPKPADPPKPGDNPPPPKPTADVPVDPPKKAGLWWGSKE
jgi:hypothetical protein